MTLSNQKPHVNNIFKAKIVKRSKLKIKPIRLQELQKIT